MFKVTQNIVATINLDLSKPPIFNNHNLEDKNTETDWFPYEENSLALIPIKYDQDRDNFINDTHSQELLDLPVYILVHENDSIDNITHISYLSNGNSGYECSISLIPQFYEDIGPGITKWSKESITKIWNKENK